MFSDLARIAHDPRVNRTLFLKKSRNVPLGGLAVPIGADAASLAYAEAGCWAPTSSVCFEDCILGLESDTVG